MLNADPFMQAPLFAFVPPEKLSIPELFVWYIRFNKDRHFRSYKFKERIPIVIRMCFLHNEI